MALIKCPQCQNEISDRASKCPNCGFEMYMLGEFGFCEECGKPLKPNVSSCQNCGCPIMPKDYKKKSNHSGVKALAIILAIVIVASLATVFTLNDLNNKKTEQYRENLAVAADLMASGGHTAAEMAELVTDVWYNTIYEKDDIKTDKYTKNGRKFNDDFNDSLANLFADAEIQTKQDEIIKNREDLTDAMILLKNPPRKYKETYEKFSECYDAYMDFTELAVYPKGSLESYTNSINEIGSRMSDAVYDLRLTADN